MTTELNLKLGLAPYDPWVLKKNLTETDLHHGGSLILPKQEFEAILREIGRGLVESLGNGVEVKLHIIEEGHESDDYTLTLVKGNGSYMLTGGWYTIARAKGYKPNDEIGLMWDKWSRRFLFHHIK
ncbi:PREDICTED: putative B3 domain-containing protein At1g51970 [Camelina sativa]|uniref:B3 domain-containing protein At1g51970 n=1 Tax=Camelina sativa TaxID=90675 RepID=A0ABM0YH46_CAMSA|nr:PREDICTED: putative B3 domain-containing protein At1g51970 [Camelina sativa]